MTAPQIRRTSWFPLLMTLAGLAYLVTGAVAWLPQPTARVALFVPASPPQVLFPVDNRPDNEAFLRNQAFLIKDPFILNRALNLPGVANLAVVKEQPDPHQWLENEIKVEFPGSEFIQISLSGDRPDELLQVVWAVRKTYLDEFFNKEAKEREVLLETTKNLYEQYVKRSKQLRANLRKLQEEERVINPDNIDQRQKIARDELIDVQKELVKVRMQLHELRAEAGLHSDWLETVWPRYVAALGSFPGSGLPLRFALIGLLHEEFLVALSGPHSLVSLAELDNDPIVVTILRKIGQLKAEVLTLRAKSPSETVFQKDSAAFRSALDLAQQELEARRRELRVRADKDALVKRATLLRDRYAQARAKEKVLQEEFERLSAMTINKARVALDLSDLKDEITKLDTLTNKAANRIAALEAEQTVPPRIREFGEGSIIMPGNGARKLMTGRAPLLVGLGVLFLAFAWFVFRVPKLRGTEALSQ